MNKKLTVCLLLAFTLLSSVLSGQEAAKALVFRSAAWEKMNEPLYYIAHKKQEEIGSEKQEISYVQLSLQEMESSQPCETVGPSGVVRFFRKDVVDGEEKYSAVAQVKVPDVSKPYIFLFFPKNAQSKAYNIYTIADSREDSPFGAYQFHNLTSMPIAGMLGKEKFNVSPKSRVRTVRFQYSDKQSLPFGLITETEGKSKWLARNTYSYNPNKHLKVFIYAVQDANGQAKVKVKGLVDFYEPKLEEISQNP